MDFYSASFFGTFTLSFLLLAICACICGSQQSWFCLSLNWKSLSILLLSAMALLNLFSWIYGFAAYQFNWASDFITFSSFVRAFPAAFIYNLLFLYPTFIFYNFTRKIIDSLSVRRRRGSGREIKLIEQD